MKKKERSNNRYIKPGPLAYALARTAAWPVSKLLFRPKVLRNEMRGKKGPYVVIANHECALDFVNLINMCDRRMTFVFSQAFYSTLPLQKIFDRMGVIHKQQFQTTVCDLRRMKAVIDAGEPLLIYPAGLMTEDGVSTPIPEATWSLFSFLDADVYMARTYGSYHVMPKWSGRFRPGRTYMDVYKLFDRQELHTLTPDEIRARASEALYYDAYADQEKCMVPYSGGDNVEGLENVVYQCPVCHEKYSITAKGNTLRCGKCGATVTADRYGFLHGNGAPKHISDWARDIHARLEKDLSGSEVFSLKCVIHTIDKARHKFRETGSGTVTLTSKDITMSGTDGGKPLYFCQNILTYPSLAFTAGSFFDLQNGHDIYRCYPEDGKIVMEFVNTVRLWHRQAAERKNSRRAGV